MKYKALALLVSLSLVTGIYADSKSSRIESVNKNNEETQILFKNYSKFLNDVSDRRSRVVYVPYSVSPKHGVQQGFVHVTSGVASFARTDMLVDSSMPIVIRRTYRSDTNDRGEFGYSGWRLTLEEKLKNTGKNKFEYVYGNGRRVTFSGAGLMPSKFDLYTSDIVGIELIDSSPVITTRTGLKKYFRLFGDEHLLTKVVDEFGNEMLMHYTAAGQLRQIDGEDGTFVTITRNGQGHIREIKDGFDRKIGYDYDDQDRLKTFHDLRGEQWSYAYNASNQLTSATTPVGLTDIEFEYDLLGRAELSSVNGFAYSFDYQVAITEVTDAFGVTTYRAHGSGQTAYVKNAIGTETEIDVDEFDRPHSLKRNGEKIATIRFRGGAQGTQQALLQGSSPQGKFSVSYDELGRVNRLTPESGVNTIVSGYGSGLRAMQVSNGQQEFLAEYDQSGELGELSYGSDLTMTFERNGSQWIVENEGDLVTLVFGPAGTLDSVITDNGLSLDFEYGNGGFRESTSISNGVRVTYNYDASGSLFYSTAGYVGQEMEGFTYVPNEYNSVTQVQTTSGESHHVEYGSNGLASKFISPRFPDLSFFYDPLGRLQSIEREGMQSITYLYEQSEADVVLQHDDKSVSPYTQHRDYVEYGTRFEQWMSRIKPATHGLFTFSDNVKELALPFDVDHWNPITPIRHTVTAMQLDSVVTHEPDYSAFAVPSNPLFIPRELWSVNCCWCGCPVHEASCSIP